MGRLHRGGPRSVSQLEEALLTAEREPGTGVIVDLGEVDLIDSSALRALILSAE